MGGGTAEWKRRAVYGENRVGDEPWVAVRAARGAEAEPSRGIEEKGGAGWGIKPWAKCFVLCRIGAGALKHIVCGMIQIRSAIEWR